MTDRAFVRTRRRVDRAVTPCSRRRSRSSLDTATDPGRKIRCGARDRVALREGAQPGRTPL